MANWSALGTAVMAWDSHRTVRFPSPTPVPRSQSRVRGEECQLGNKLYVGNLPFSVTEDELRDLFARHGEVQSVNVIMDRETGRPRGFGFIEMGDSSAASDAMRALDGSDLGGRNIKVNEAQDRQGGGGGRERRDRY